MEPIPWGLFRPGEQFLVDTPDARVAMIFANVNDGVPMPVSVRCGGARAILRFGGTAGRGTPESAVALYAHARAAFAEIELKRVVLMSGGTRVLGDDDQVVMTILELPWLIRKWHPTCRTLGSTPRTTETTSLIADSRFIPSDQVDSRSLVHPGIDAFWFVQLSASETTDDWGLDVPLYFDLFDIMREEGAATGLWVWGGGSTTAQEITLATTRSHPCAVVKGSGRLADAVAACKEARVGQITPVLNRHVTHPERSLIQQMLDNGADLGKVDVLNTPRQTRRWLRQINIAA